MRWRPIFLVFLATGCAGNGGSWPSLARRPIEGMRVPPTAKAVSAPVTPMTLPTAAPVPAPLPPALGDVPAQLATIDRDAAHLGTRIGDQRGAAADAATAAKGSKADSEAWAKAQLELTRLERLGNQVGDLRGRLDAIAGELAAAAAGGSDVAVPLKATGTVIGRIDAIQAEFEATYSKASVAATP